MMDKSHEFFELQPLEPQLMGYALVGRFFSMWAVVEIMMNNVIRSALKMDERQTAITTAHIDVAVRTHMIRTFINESKLSVADKAAYDTLLKEITKLSEKRNIYAHSPFIVDDGRKFVAFGRIKAKSKLDINLLQVTIEEFDTQDKLMADYADRLGDLANALDSAST